jgi:oligopeptide/dipeptide ABC transporter ATP-binding protein
MSTPLLELHDLDVEIPLADGTLHAVRGVSLTAYPGQAVGLVGESGSGKSLTLRAAMDLLPVPARITGGSVVVAGRDVTGLKPAQRRALVSSSMAMIFQDALTALNPTMRIGDQVAEVPRQRLGMSASAARARALDLLHQVGIRDPEQRYRAFPHELSGGMRQRICIAIALSAEPGLILADEPTTALDVTIQAQVLGVLDGLRQEGVGLVLVTHDLAVVSSTCSELNVMYGGRVVEHGATDVLLSAPRHPYTAALLRSVPDPDEPVHRLLTIPGAPPDLLQTIDGCAFAPRCLAVVERCVTERPPLMGVSRGAGGAHTSACWRADEPERWPGPIAEAALGVAEELRVIEERVHP